MTDGPFGFVGRIVAVLEQVGIPYMIVGGVATLVHGRPRTTLDLDVVVQLGGRDARRLVAALPEDTWYADEEAAVDAVLRQGSFYVIEHASGWKADLIVRRRDAFARQEFERRRSATLGGMSITVVSAEDLVLSKLAWAARGGSDRQLDDVRGILAAQGDRFDRDHVEAWVDALGVRALWDRVR